MKNKRNLFIAIVGVVAMILILILCVSYRDRKKPCYPLEKDDDMASNVYVEQVDMEKFSWRVLESETKEYVTLFIETKLFDDSVKAIIEFDSSKYILDKANPLLEEIAIKEIEECDGKKFFELELDSITNYSVDFIKKNLTNIPNVNDIDVN